MTGSARIRTRFPHEVRSIDHLWIPLGDGTRLSARVWMPVDAENSPVPAVLEYLPYRKDDGTALGDALQHPYFAGHGYASVRVDLRGSGDSDGYLRGEYLKQEQDDALEVLTWLAEQPWCTGSVGMIGYSWGGFNGLQIAARAPEQLKAVITMASTDDRYLDDCHYMGGCMLASDMLKWASSMLGYAIQPPDPHAVGDGWREQWIDRLEHAPELAHDWVAHQRRDAFWRHGSVAEDYAAIRCPVMAVGGWADAYVNAVPRLLEHLDVPRLGIIGPWGHMMPHSGVPGPAIGFLQESVRWWDRWLKGIDNDIMAEPVLRAWIEEPVAPTTFRAERPGRWIGISEWPASAAEPIALHPNAAGGLADVRAPEGEVALPARQECGETAGVWCANGLSDELAGDQSPDDERSLTFTTAPLAEQIEVLGNPRLTVCVAADRPHALIAARLEDVAPCGESLLVSWGLLNLTHRDSHAVPAPLEPGRAYDVAIELRACGHRFAPGHRLRLALSSTYWPHAWPSPEGTTVTLHLAGSELDLPVVPGGRAVREYAEAGPFSPPETAPPLPQEPGDGATRSREVRVDAATGRHTIHDTQRIAMSLPGGQRRVETGTDTYEITEGEPLSATVRCVRDVSSERPDHTWSIHLDAAMTCDATTFFIDEAFSARDGEGEVFSATREYRIPRDGV